MITNLISIDTVLNTVGSSLFTFTHMLHSRYNSKTDLDTYLQHPNHLSVVQSVLPLCEDFMIIDDPTMVISPECAVRVTFLKLKESLGEEVKDEVLGVIKENLRGIEQFTCGENFSPDLAKGFSIASIAIFKGVNEMEKADSNLEKVKDYMESMHAIDYVVPSPSNL